MAATPQTLREEVPFAWLYLSITPVTTAPIGSTFDEELFGDTDCMIQQSSEAKGRR
jgi:hypothetical protein